MPNLNAQMSKLWQDREWLLRDDHRFCQLYDAIRRSVPEELRCLSQVIHAQRIETHQARTYEIGGEGIVRQHDPSEITRRAMERPIALHPNDSVGNDEVCRNRSVDIEYASLNPLAVQQVLRPAIGDTWDNTEQVLHAQCYSCPVVCFHPGYRDDDVARQYGPREPQFSRGQ